MKINHHARRIILRGMHWTRATPAELWDWYEKRATGLPGPVVDRVKFMLEFELMRSEGLLTASQARECRVTGEVEATFRLTMAGDEAEVVTTGELFDPAYGQCVHCRQWHPLVEYDGHKICRRDRERMWQMDEDVMYDPSDDHYEMARDDRMGLR